VHLLAQTMADDPKLFVRITGFVALVAITAGVVTALAMAARADMDARDQAGRRYGVAIVLLPPVGLLLWAIGRARHPKRHGRLPVSGDEPGWQRRRAR